MTKLWRKGVLFSLASFVANLGHMAFQTIIGHRLGKDSAEYGYVNATLGFVALLGIPLQIGSTAVTHYIAHFHAKKDDARFLGLLAGCRKLLFWMTVAGSIAGMLLLKPLGDFFHVPRTILMLVALITLLGQLWTTFGTALCQGLAWYQRLAVLGLIVAVIRLAFGAVVLPIWPTAEAGVLATTCSLLANLILLFWRKDLARKGDALSPYNREFAGYLAVSAALVAGGWCFSQGDLLAAQRNLSGTFLTTYSSAGVLGRALPNAVVPALWVIFTSRSGDSSRNASVEQLKLLGLCGVGLIFGAGALMVLRNIFLKIIFGTEAPAASAMVGPLAATMVSVGLIQALGMWALASRWFRVSILYGVAGAAYWLALLCWGKTPAALLHLMPLAAAGAFLVIFAAWLVALRREHALAAARSSTQ